MVCAHIDKVSRVFMVCNISFKDSFTDLESLIIGLGPKKCLIPSSGGSRDFCNKLVKCLEKNNILVTERKESIKKNILFKFNKSNRKKNSGEFSCDLSCVDLNCLVSSSNDQNIANTGWLSVKIFSYN